MAKQLYVSYSSLSAFRKCPRYYYWRHIRKLERKSFKLPFIVGRIMHHGLQTLLEKPEQAEQELEKKYKEEAKAARKEHTLSPIEEDELAAQEFLTKGMMQAFRRYYKKFLARTEHKQTEFPIKYELNKNVVIVGQIDNIITNQNAEWLWELKNLKTLDMERVITIKTDPQTNLYYKVHNLMVPKGDRLDGIIYQIIRKPSIRQKQKESRREFLNRLQDWYSSGEGGMKFHLERIKGSFIDGKHILNMVDKVSKQMLACKDREDFFQDFSACVSEWDKCHYYGLCHGDENKEIKLLQIRKPYKVQFKNEDADLAVSK